MSDGLDEIRNSDGSATRADIRAVLEDCASRRADGEAVSDRDIINAHPELMPELGEELRKLRIIGAARKKAFGPRVRGREDIDALSVLVDLFGQDDAVMAGVFEKAGGATVLNAIHNAARSGYENNDDTGHLAAAIALVTGLRAGLGRVSTAWDSQDAAGEAKARKFASELLGAVDHERHTSTVGFLFGDTDRARMGERFTVALADEMDRWERDGVMTPWHDSDPGMSYLPGRMAAATSTLRLRLTTGSSAWRRRTRWGISLRVATSSNVCTVSIRIATSATFGAP
jgi:hypothetical protein